MDLFESCRNYVKTIFSYPDEGMKVLIVDSTTVKYVSTLFVMSEIMDYEIYLVENIKSIREEMKPIKCITILRPTSENINLLSQELKRNLYGSYYIFFTHVLPKNKLQQLASADEHELVKEVHEFYIDFIPNSPFQFNVDMDNSLSLLNNFESDKAKILTESVSGSLMTLGRVPKIFYASESISSKALAESVRSFVNREERFFRNSDLKPISLVIIDRSFDPITPLVNQWTYEAMIHEMIGIKNNRVRLAGAQSGKEVILSYSSDDFFKKNQFANFGEIGESIKRLVDDYQSKLQSVDVKNVESIGDLKKFLENYPNFKKTSGTVETHFSILSELSRAVKDYHLMDLSECEQELVCQENHSQSYSKITSLLNDPSLRPIDCIRLVLLYTLRYPSYTSDIENLRGLLTKKGLQRYLNLIPLMKDFTQKDFSAQTLKSVGNFNDIKSSNVNQFASKAMNLVTKKLVSGLKGVDNVYSQHQPAIVDLIQKVVRNQTERNLLTKIDTNVSPRDTYNKDILLFIIGGMTYAEVNAVHKLNRELDAKIYLGSTYVHNTKSFLDELEGSSGRGLSSLAGDDELLDGRTGNQNNPGFFSRNIASKFTTSAQYSKLN